jgi:hypothetical protein
MKKIFICLLLSTTLWSCKKANEGYPALKPSMETKFEVTLNFSDFSSEVTNISKHEGNTVLSASLKKSTSYLTYIVYDKDGVEVSRIRQDSSGTTTRIIREEGENEVPLSQKGYGCIKDSLIAGNYTVVIAASNTLFEINNRSTGLGFEFFDLNDAHFQYQRGLDSYYRTSDTYYKKFALNVSKKDVQKPIVLDRIVGKVEINILDAKAGEKFQYQFENENDSFRFLTEKPFGELSESIFQGYQSASASYFILNTETPINVLISYEENGIATEKLITGVMVYKNKRTILKGNVHSSAKSTSGFDISVNSQFDEEPLEISF